MEKQVTMSKSLTFDHSLELAEARETSALAWQSVVESSKPESVLLSSQ